MQIAEAAAQAPDRTSELLLKPEELGRLRLSIATTEHGVAVQITAERSETLDLVRRHLDLLAEDLRRMGFAGVSVDLSQGNSWTDGHAGAGRRSAAGAAPDPVPPVSDEPATAQPARADRATGNRGLDLRL